MIDRKYVSCGIQTNDYIYENYLNEKNQNSILRKSSKIHLYSPIILKKIHFINNNNIMNKNNNNCIDNNNDKDNLNGTIKLKKRILKNFENIENNFNDNFNIIEGKKISQKKLIMPKIEKKTVKFPINTFGVNSVFQKYKNTSININFLNKNKNKINNNNTNLIYQNDLINPIKSFKLIDKTIIRKNRSLNSFEKIITKNNGNFFFISFKEESSKPSLYKSRSFRNYIKRKFSNNKNYLSNQNCLFTFRNKQNREC